MTTYEEILLPLDEIPPVELVEIAGDGAAPPETWGQDGEGADR